MLNKSLIINFFHEYGVFQKGKKIFMPKSCIFTNKILNFCRKIKNKAIEYTNLNFIKNLFGNIIWVRFYSCIQRFFGNKDFYAIKICFEQK